MSDHALNGAATPLQPRKGARKRSEIGKPFAAVPPPLPDLAPLAVEIDEPPPVATPKVIALLVDGEDNIPLWEPDPALENARREREERYRQEQEEAQRRALLEEPLRGLLHLSAYALVGAAAHSEAAARPITYVWSGVACPGNIILISGAPGEGKTSLTYLCLAARRNRTGVPILILGRAMLPAHPQKWIVLLQEEHGETSSARKLRGSVEMLGLPPDTLDGVISLARKQAIVGSPLWLEVCELVKRGQVDSLWIDSLSRFQRRDSDSEEEQAAVFAEVQRAIEAAPGHEKPTTWFVAHSKKGATGSSLEDVSGSTQRTAQSDSVLLVKAVKVDGRVVSARVVFCKVREDDGESPDPATFEITRGTDGKKRVLWGVAPPTAPLHEQIFAALAAGPLTKSELRKALKRNDVAIDEGLSVLFAEHRARKVKKKVGGREWAAFARSVVTDDDLFATLGGAP